MVLAPPSTVENPKHTALDVQSAVKTSPSKAQPINKTKGILPSVKPTIKPAQQKPLSGRSSKPIINWFQRKLAGTGRTKRIENRRPTTEPVPLGKGRGKQGPLTPRTASSPIPSPAFTGGRQQGRVDTLATIRRKTISLSGDDNISVDEGDDASLDQSSLAHDSTWSPGSALEADDDASVRPIPPSVPPSPSPSRSSSSHLSDPRTFRSIAASTKPTTLLSIDLNGNGMAHIAQAPATPPTYIHRFPPHLRNSSSTTNPALHGSGTSITFSALPQSSSRPSSSSSPGSPGTFQTTLTQGLAAVSPVQAPLHTAHHPRNNPRPSSPPLDNASVLTLASSAYAIPGIRTTIGYSTTPSARGGVGDSLSHFGGSITYNDTESTSQFVLGDDDRLEERDVDASVRALRPRSSRRGSWESEASRWSARVQLGAGTPSLTRERSIRTTTSIKMSPFGAENPETFEQSEEIENIGENEKDESLQPEQRSRESSVSESSSPLTNTASENQPSEVHDSSPIPVHNAATEASVGLPHDVDRKLSIDTVAKSPKATTHLPLSAAPDDTNKLSTPEVKIPNHTYVNEG